ncbi:MAG: hypothetical protein E6K76_08165 [Candidatus Eisenbacteria bacterium]|uniref:Uncharacterized protein n=1 Tax=Eiseniibacteriota bacterium TaxID=2212470 RepID=A0A538T4C4_UNCEI|nr:MAG: hypothetical protein E6K76_08165 [Candidatus Eisenbacteria bacterium]
MRLDTVVLAAPTFEVGVNLPVVLSVVLSLVLFNEAHLFGGGFEGGFSVSSGEPAHTTVGPIALA